MIKNYLKIAIRNLYRYKGYSVINILGLAVGLSACILIMLFIQNELSYDQFHTKKDRIYRVTREWFNTDGTSSLYLARVAPPIGPLLWNNYPDGIESMVRIRSDYNTLLKIGDKKFIENRFLWVEKTIFDIFSFDLLRGDPKTALEKPNTVVLTRSTAIKLFDSIDMAIGKIINYEGENDLLVTGVVEDVPENSHFKFDYLGSLQTLIDDWGIEFFTTNWGRNNYGTYFLLAKNYSASTLQQQIPAFLDKHLTERSLAENGQPPSRKPSESTMLHLQKLTDIHLHSHLNSEWEVNGNINNVYLFTAIAFFILLIACINFMNLATARSSKRAKEIGMRKAMGAQRKSLIKQFLGESIFITFISLILAVILVKISLPYFNDFVGKNLSLDITYNLQIVPVLLALVVCVGVLAGSYPALYLSRFLPLTIIKDVSTVSSNRSLFRRILVVLQFSISIILIICMAIVYSQVDFQLNKNLGYNKEHVLLLPSDQNIMEKMESVKARLLQNKNVLNVAGSRLVPTNSLVNSWGGKRLDGEQPEPLSFRLAVQECDYDFIDTYRMKIVAGRNFSKEYSTDDSAAFILNEAAVKKIGWDAPEEAVGKPLEYGNHPGRIVGVLQDFNFESLHNEIVPIIFLINKSSLYTVSVRISPEEIPATLRYIENIWTSLRPDYPFKYTFLDEQYHNLYQSDVKLGQIFGMFSVLAIFIACLGLLGMVSFTAEQKTKEIGIRKVLGASVVRIVFLLTKEFSKWVIIANLIAWPLAWFAMSRWLQDFAYRIDIGLSVFVLSGAITLLIALVTISFQAIKAATANPIESLRYE